MMQVTLTREAEQIIKEQLQLNPGFTPEQIIEPALRGYRLVPLNPGRKDPAEAVRRIRENRKGVTLGGLKIKDLINEGRKY